VYRLCRRSKTFAVSRICPTFTSMLSLDLTGKTALIGGSTQGIGLASAQALASLGARCVLISRNEGKLKEAILTLDTRAGQQHTYLVADYANPAQVQEVVSGFVAANTVHILINNSGGPAGGPVTKAKPEEFINAFQQHLICNHIITTLVIDGMKQAGYGRVINIISTSVKIPLKDLGVSNTIRGAVASWAKTMANELGQFGITVNNVLPGATSTERLAAIINNKSAKTGKTKEETEQEMMAEVPARRFGKPEEIAAMVAFLASPAAAYVNGTSIPVDGGRTGSI
jgi:3-oxoacyl-[acyl-carrier protein] reductase